MRGVKRSARVLGIAVLAVAATGGTALPLARGATTTDVAVSNNVFTQSDVTITQGDTVRWTRTQGTHNVHFDDGTTLPGPPSNGWTTESRTFATPGDYAYVCDAHADQGMIGVVHVVAAPPTPPQPQTPAPTPPPPTGGPGVVPPPPQGAAAARALRDVRVVRTRFCTRRTRRCTHPGVVLAIDLAAPADVSGALERAAPRGRARYKAFGRVDFGRIPTGKRRLVFSRTQTGRRLKGGRYRLALSADGATRTLRFGVRAS